MKVIGLKDGSVLASDENGAHQFLQFQAGQEVDIPEQFAWGAVCAGYAKVAEPADSEAGE